MEALDQSDVLLVMTPWSEFEAISTIDLDRGMRGRTIIDPYGILNGSGLVDKGFTYATLGKPVQHPERNN
jgi:UDPglucose 6-dehydrogenase